MMITKKSIKLKMKLLKLNRIFSKRELFYFSATTALLVSLTHTTKAMGIDLSGRVLVLPFLGIGSQIIMRNLIPESRWPGGFLNYNKTNNKPEIIENIWHDLFLRNQITNLEPNLAENYKSAFLEIFDFASFVKKSKNENKHLHQNIMQAYIEDEYIAKLIINANKDTNQALVLLRPLLEANDFKVNSKDQQKIRNKIKTFNQPVVEILTDEKVYPYLEDETIDCLIRKCNEDIFNQYSKRFGMIRDHQAIAKIKNPEQKKTIKL